MNIEEYTKAGIEVRAGTKAGEKNLAASLERALELRDKKLGVNINTRAIDKQNAGTEPIKVTVNNTAPVKKEYRPVAENAEPAEHIMKNYFIGNKATLCDLVTVRQMEKDNKLCPLPYISSPAQAVLDYQTGQTIGGAGVTSTTVSATPRLIAVMDEYSNTAKTNTGIDFNAMLADSCEQAITEKVEQVILDALTTAAKARTVALDINVIINLICDTAINQKLAGAQTLILNHSDFKKIITAYSSAAQPMLSVNAISENYGVISSNGFSCSYYISDLATTPIFAKLNTCNLVTWGDLEIATSESGAEFLENKVRVRGVLECGAVVCAADAVETITFTE